jgi:hypothetical protein
MPMYLASDSMVVVVVALVAAGRFGSCKVCIGGGGSAKIAVLSLNSEQTTPAWSVSAAPVRSLLLPMLFGVGGLQARARRKLTDWHVNKALLIAVSRMHLLHWNVCLV